jgi:hypothetical protein
LRTLSLSGGHGGKGSRAACGSHEAGKENHTQQSVNCITLELISALDMSAGGSPASYQSGCAHSAARFYSCVK